METQDKTIKAQSSLSFMQVDLNLLAVNYQILTESALGQKIGAVIKGNAYGLGKREVFETLFNAGCSDFFLSDWQEVIDLPHRKAFYQNARFYALAGISPDEQSEVASFGVIPVFHRKEEIIHWSNLYGKSKECVIQIETGLNRLGIDELEITTLASLVDVKFFLNHFSCGYNPKSLTNKIQFEIAARISQKTGIPVSMGSSCMFNLNSQFMRSSCMLRAGRYLYGIRSGLKKDSAIYGKIQPVASVFACMIARKQLRAGDSTGYDDSYIASKPKLIGILNIGYSSGCILEPKKSKVFSNGRFFEILSQSMDFTMIDIDSCDVVEGALFEIFGKNIEQYHLHRITIPSDIVKRSYRHEEGALLKMEQ